MNKVFIFLICVYLFSCRSKYTEEETHLNSYRVLRTEYYEDAQEEPVQTVYPEHVQMINFNAMPYPYETASSFRLIENDKVIYEANYENCGGNITSILIPQMNDVVSSHFRRFVIDGKRAMIIYKKSNSEYVLVERSNLGDVVCDDLDQHVGPGIQLVGDETIHFLERLDNEPGF